VLLDTHNDLSCGANSLKTSKVDFGTDMAIRALDWVVDFPRCRDCAWLCKQEAVRAYCRNPSTEGYLDALYSHMRYFQFETFLDGLESTRFSLTRPRKRLPDMDLPDFESGRLKRAPATQACM
jgi:hypothetical protein